ncbi:uncharacterized protein EV154DRAFT_12233 [Mucor mucedo]|uniref:uncharacterized protein n=1 Tax=Mucor mucedo TaxID=29922 RepID=UPI00221EE652|nr:uncharacterized protein EV154DRAFT_575369 [Mucor mucedo]XP_051454102.1 uncharacterized protein EV154DRAFT_12233 [Mucor mucedo]KAI7882147.1 hypothetical protein EV154DRAFT_575369 [Mucor mucedo]KAI7887685.1 hypothetical protein EV154DRAFT_12233 [Mucor mucedo]
MKSWSNLPEEVLLIFNSNDNTSFFEDRKLLEKKDIFQCELVCRNWKLPAQRTNYKSLTVSSRDTKNLINALKSSQESPGKFVKELILPNSTNGLWKQCLPAMADIFPFIDTLEVHEPNEDFYSTLISISSASKWKGLKNFEFPNNDSDLGMYASCVQNYQRSLERLLVCDKIQLIHANEGGINNELYFSLLKELGQFSKLKELVIKRHANDCLESFDKIIEKCQNLRKLDIGIYPNLTIE